MTLQDALKSAKTKISLLDAEILLSFVLEKDQAWILSHLDEEISVDENKKFQLLVERRGKHEPISYIKGYKEFFGRNFVVTPDVLIPRPETEILIDKLENEPLKVLDIGTGSGCIAITLKLEYPKLEVTASDISEKALELAKNNAKQLKADVKFIKSDLLNNIKQDFDIIIANLPYLSQKDIDNSPTSKDLGFEPQTALLADDNGLALIKRLIDQTKPGPVIYLEMLNHQIPEFKAWLEKKHSNYNFETFDKHFVKLTFMV